KLTANPSSYQLLNRFAIRKTECPLLNHPLPASHPFEDMQVCIWMVRGKINVGHVSQRSLVLAARYTQNRVILPLGKKLLRGTAQSTRQEHERPDLRKGA